MAMTKWVPEADPKIQRRVGKTGEEAAELLKVISRIQIQGLAGVDPATGKHNRQALTEEIADVLAQCKVTVEELDLDSDFILERAALKVEQMAQWEAMFDADPT